eukprot:CAMPEP_0115043188 /NCGR_PEP_ID=MMETSP0216-20121206/46718_1 /TAXON_ID=223996 /ORGANISM="Protocruzia adherens, Strain Boccale" /LENGTH=186 /DNA_ID=CAMNT_0002425457 /DNA_START=159 /DNA_END=715 /DNA_ORIENTATION=+
MDSDLELSRQKSGKLNLQVIVEAQTYENLEASPRNGEQQTYENLEASPRNGEPKTNERLAKVAQAFQSQKSIKRAQFHNQSLNLTNLDQSRLGNKKKQQKSLFLNATSLSQQSLLNLSHSLVYRKKLHTSGMLSVNVTLDRSSARGSVEQLLVEYQEAEQEALEELDSDEEEYSLADLKHLYNYAP